MKSSFLDKLGADIKRLVEEIEDFSSTEIQVRPTPTPTNESAQSPKAIALIASEHGATLLCRDAGDFQPQAVLHELLHLRRYWIDSVPQILPVDDPDGEKIKLANQIENTLEHLIIVPQEREYGFEPYAYYREATRKNWQAYPWPAISEPWARRKNCLLSWLTTYFLVRDPTIKQSAKRRLEQEGLSSEAERFSQKIERVLSSKEQCISTAIRFLQIPHQQATMVYLDIKNQRTIRKPVSLH
ncbi:MAG: hypothetical protein OES46_04905 [Gammaproteobacteria bacterium]|nr:hypothetical protein [Gammaproteobacteria bacterium]